MGKSATRKGSGFTGKTGSYLGVKAPKIYVGKTLSKEGSRQASSNLELEERHNRGNIVEGPLNY